MDLFQCIFVFQNVKCLRNMCCKWKCPDVTKLSEFWLIWVMRADGRGTSPCCQWLTIRLSNSGMSCFGMLISLLSKDLDWSVECTDQLTAILPGTKIRKQINETSFQCLWSIIWRWTSLLTAVHSGCRNVRNDSELSRKSPDRLDGRDGDLSDSL